MSTAAPAKRVYPDRIIIETSGSAFPTPLVHEIDRVAKSTHIIIDFAAYMRFMRKFHIFVDYLDNLYYSWLSIVYTTIINDFYLIQHLTLFSLLRLYSSPCCSRQRYLRDRCDELHFVLRHVVHGAHAGQVQRPHRAQQVGARGEDARERRRKGTYQAVLRTYLLKSVESFQCQLCNCYFVSYIVISRCEMFSVLRSVNCNTTFLHQV